MRITCSKTERGNVYRFYRDDDRFHDDLKALIPFLRACEGELHVGDPDGKHAIIVLEVGPDGASPEIEFLRQARRHLADGCPTGVR
jgi:hypothetical protein